MFALLFFAGCETFDLDQTEDPSSLNERFLDPVLAYNFVQLELPNYVNTTNFFTQRVIRQMAMTGGNNYDNAFAPVNFNQHWNQAYRILNAIKALTPKAVAQDQKFILGATKIIRCYILLTLVDIYGDIPYSEALMGNSNLTPKYDKSADVYKGILSEIDESISMLSQSTEVLPSINMYYSDKLGWIKLANTLKLKIYTNARLAGSELNIIDLPSAISTIVVSNNYIKNAADDFEFKYGNSRFNPNTRHPLYNNQYELGGGSYISNYFIWTMTVEKDGIDDPRTDFYFYKQSSNPAANVSVINSTTRPNHYSDLKYRSFYNNVIQPPFIFSNWTTTSSVVPSNGYWGRDHGDNSGIPQDANFRTVIGVYPIGGKFSSTAATVQTGGNKGAQGAGIVPIILSSYVNFMLSEAYLTIPGLATSQTADAKASLNLAINQSIDKTVNFLPNETKLTTSQQALISTRKINYLNFINVTFDQLSTTKKLELIIKEYNIATWGNGIESYNSYRRTGFPSNFQPTVESFSGDFYYTAFYAGAAVNNNPNAPANNFRTRRVFWDKANLILH